MQNPDSSIVPIDFSAMPVAALLFAVYPGEKISMYRRQIIRIARSIAIVLWAVTAASPALAQNIGFLHQGPIAYLDDVDRQILSDTFNAALEEGENGETVAWSNPDTGHTGTIEVLDTHEDYGTTCRTVRTFTQAGGRKGGGVYRLCLADDDTWQFAPKRRKKSS